MPDYSRPLGDTVRKAREQMGMTQSQVAELLNIDVRTLLNIENYKGNPKMEILFPLICALNIDPRNIFNSEKFKYDASRFKLQQLIDSCDGEEIEAILAVADSMIKIMRTKSSKNIK